MRKKTLATVFGGLAILLILSQCTGNLLRPELAFNKALPDKYSCPDGMTLGDDHCIYLSMNNANNKSYPSKILRITEEDRIEEIIDLLPHPETGVASPLGLTFASDGNLYISDNQSFATDRPNMSRLLKVSMEDGSATKCEVVATGFNMANGITTHGNRIYVAETNLDAGEPLKSGVYRFELSELNAENPVHVKGILDPHLITILETKSPEYQVGANGLAFNSKGELYVCNFGDAEVLKLLLDPEGNVSSSEVFASGDGMLSADGMQIDKDDNLWIADFIGNAIVQISPEGKVRIVAKNGQSDGRNGELDAPSECIRRGNRIYVSNIDLSFGPNESDPIHTMSIIEL